MQGAWALAVHWRHRPTPWRALLAGAGEVNIGGFDFTRGAGVVAVEGAPTTSIEGVTGFSFTYVVPADELADFMATDHQDAPVDLYICKRLTDAAAWTLEPYRFGGVVGQAETDLLTGRGRATVEPLPTSRKHQAHIAPVSDLGHRRDADGDSIFRWLRGVSKWPDEVREA